MPDTDFPASGRDNHWGVIITPLRALQRYEEYYRRFQGFVNYAQVRQGNNAVAGHIAMSVSSACA